MELVRINNRETTILSSENHVYDIVADKLGFEFADAMMSICGHTEEIEDLKEDIKGLNDELNGRDESLHNYEGNFSDITDIANNLISYLLSTKRIKRDELIENLKKIKELAEY